MKKLLKRLAVGLIAASIGKAAFLSYYEIPADNGQAARATNNQSLVNDDARFNRLINGKITADSLSSIVKILNTGTPIDVDAETKLVSLYSKGMFFSFQYRLANYAYNKANEKLLLDNLREGLVRGSCNGGNGVMVTNMLRGGVTVDYAYYANDSDEVLAQIDILPADCGF